MSGNNIQKSKSPRPIAIAPAPDKSSLSIPTSSSSSAALIGGGNEINGNRKLAPRPSDESANIKPFVKIQPNNIKKDSPPTAINNANHSSNGRLIAPAPPPPSLSSQHSTTAAAAAITTTATTTAATTSGQQQMLAGPFVLRPVSNQNQSRMYPFFSPSAAAAAAASAHPHLQQRLQATIDPNGNIINNNNNQNHQILTENQLHLLQQQQQRHIIQQQQHQQQQQQQRPPAPIPIAPRPVATPSTSSEATPSSSSSTATPSTNSSTSTALNGGGIKPPKICPRPIEKKPTPQSTAGASTSTAGTGMNPQSIIPTPQLNPAFIGFAPNGTPVGYLHQHPSALHLSNQQLRFIQPQGLTRLQMSHLSPMGIFPQQIIHPGALFSAAGGNATFIHSQGIPNNPQYLSISGFNPNQIQTSFMNSLNSQVSQHHQQQQQQLHHQQQQQLHQQQLQQQQQQQLQPKLIPITPNPSTSMTATIPSMSSVSTSSSNPPLLLPRPPPLAPAAMIPIASAAATLDATKTMKSLEGATSDDDENEPPPLLDRDETVPPSVHEAFVQEAAGVRMQLPALGVEGGEPYKHVIDGFVIEESAVPFEIDGTLKDPLEYLRNIAKQTKIKKEEMEAAEKEAAEKEEQKDSKKGIKKIKVKKPSTAAANEVPENTGPKKRGRRSNNDKNNTATNSSNGKNKKQVSRSPSPVLSNRKRRSSSSTQQQQSRRVSPAKSTIKSPPSSDRPGSSKSSRTSREIQQLLTMDFGPKIQIFKTNSVDEYTKNIKRGQQTSLRPVMQQDYKERSPEISREGDEQQCLNCRFTFAQLKLRCIDHPQYCTKECRKQYRKRARRDRQQQAEAKLIEQQQQQQTSSSSSSNINEMAAALIGKSSPPPPEHSSTRKRLSNESETSVSMKSPTLKLRFRSSTDLESPASASQILSPIPNTSAFLLPSMPGPSSTPTYANMMNTSNGSIPAISSPPPSLAGPSNSNPHQNAPDFARITEQIALNPHDANSWSAEDVGRWVNAITNSQTIGEIFVNEEMDGSILFMLTQNQISSELKIKLGPTLKIVNAITWLRNL